MKILSAFKSTFTKFVALFTSGKAQSAAATVAALIPKALPYVELVASLTPTMADDEVIALFKTYGLPYVDAYLGLPKDQRGAALLRAASTMLAREVPGTPTHVLDAAVQLALVGSRAEAAQ